MKLGKLGNFRRGNFGITTALLILLAIAAANALTWFKPLDNMLQNGCVWLTASSQNDDQLLLVYADPKSLESASPQLISLVKEINQHSPKKIAIEATGSIKHFTDLDRLPFASHLTVGFRFDDLRSQRPSFQKNQFKTGFIDLHHSRQPIYRNGITSMKGHKAPLGSFELEVAKSVSPLTDNLPGNSFGIRYRGGANTFANIKANELMNGNMLRKFIKDKIVLIGPDYPREFHMLTPTTTGESRMARLEVRGNMIASLLNENYATNLALLPSLMLIALVTWGSIQIARQTPKRWLPTIALATLVVTWSLFALSYWLTSVWLPVTAIILAGLFSMAAVVLQRFTKLEDYIQFWKMRSTTREAHLQSRFDEDVWRAIGDVASQMFQPTRVVMMELEPGETHLKRVRSIGCDYSQIYEKRLDFKRAPYWEPIQKKQAMSSQRSFYVSAPGIRETEYILPLVHGLNIYGVIVLAMKSETLETWADFDSFINRFSSEVSRLVTGSREAQALERQKVRWIDRWQTLPEERAFIDIQSDTQKQDDLLERVDVAFNFCESAMATFDIYGRVIRRNSNLNRLLQKTELSVSRASCVEILATLGGLTMNEARKIFRDAILDDKSDRRLIANPALAETTMMMYVKPMQLQEDDVRTSIETHGILLEIVDGRVFEEVREWNHELSTAMVPKVLRKASELEETTARLKNHGVQEQTLNDLFGSVGNTVSEIVSVLEDCKQLSSQKVTELPENYFLLNFVPVWESAKARFSEKLMERSISISESFSDQDEIKAIANPILLNRTFSTVLQFLLDNAFDDSEIRVETEPTIDGYELRFTNQGGGTPVDALRKSLGQADDSTARHRKDKFPNLDATQVDQLRQIDHWIDQWNGSLSVQNLPHCLTISITLSKIEFDPVENSSSDTSVASPANGDTTPDPSLGSTQQ